MFSLIACIGKNRELGKGGELVFHLKDDVKFFRETTMGHKVVMGRKTWESLPGKLKGRENIVVSRHQIEGVDELVNDMTEFITENAETKEEIFVIGGGMIYKAFLNAAKCLYLTEVEREEPEADTFFPEFDMGKYTKEIIRKGVENGIKYSIAKYTLK